MKTETEINAQRAEIIALIKKTSDHGLIDQVYEILHGQEEPWWDEAAEKPSWEESDADITAGRLTSLHQVRQEFREWMKE